MKKIGLLERMLHTVKIDKFKKMTLYFFTPHGGRVRSFQHRSTLCWSLWSAAIKHCSLQLNATRCSFINSARYALMRCCYHKTLLHRGATDPFNTDRTLCPSLCDAASKYSPAVHAYHIIIDKPLRWPVLSPPEVSPPDVSSPRNFPPRKFPTLG